MYMQRSSTILLVGVIGLLSLAGGWGCNDPGVQNRMARREAKLSRTMNTLDRIERKRAESLVRTEENINRELRTRPLKFEKACARMDDYFSRQFSDWEYNDPRRRQAIADWAAGNPDRAEFAFLCYF